MFSLGSVSQTAGSSLNTVEYSETYLFTNFKKPGVCTGPPLKSSLLVDAWRIACIPVLVPSEHSVLGFLFNSIIKQTLLLSGAPKFLTAST